MGYLINWLSPLIMKNIFMIKKRCKNLFLTYSQKGSITLHKYLKNVKLPKLASIGKERCLEGRLGIWLITIFNTSMF